MFGATVELRSCGNGEIEQASPVIMYRLAHEKKITGLPQIYVLTLSLQDLTYISNKHEESKNHNMHSADSMQHIKGEENK